MRNSAISTEGKFRLRGLAKDSSGADRIEEAIDLYAQVLRLLRQFPRRRQHFLRNGAGVLRRVHHPGYIQGDLFGMVGRLVNVLRDFLGRGALLFDGAGDGFGNRAHLIGGLDDGEDEPRGSRRRIHENV